MNMTTRLAIIGLFCILMPVLSAQPVYKQLTGHVKNINQFNLMNPQEKVYLHFDNTGYYLGETIWFKAYVVSATHHESASLSKILHVELLTPQGIVADSRKLKIENGQCHGEFQLGSKYRSGFYEIRAFTRSMLNFGEECMFSRVFPIYSRPQTAGDYADKKMDASNILINKRKKAEKAERINLEFYPEGGHAVIGLRSRIAFKATGKQGEDIDITGTVYNANGEIVTTLTTLHQGMGFFELTPEPGVYKVVAECEGKKRTFPFTGIASSGYVMQANHLNDSIIQIQVQKSATLPDDTVAISISSRGQVYGAEIIKTGNKPYIFHLPKTELPAGCLQFTLFDRLGNILAERLAFNEGQPECLTVEITQDQAVYKPLKQVQMEFHVKDKDGNPANGTFSVAVRDAGTELHTGYQDNILTQLLLSSDIKGYIKDPMQYFVNPNRTSRTRLDLLMLVQGWRRYNWQTMAEIIPLEVKYYAEEGLDISGKVLGWSKDKIETGGTVTYWMLKDGEAFHGKCKTDENGRFHFLLPDNAKVGQKRELGLQYNVKGKRQHCRILLDRPSPQGKAYSSYDVFVKDSLTVFEEQTDSLEKTSISETQYLKEAIVQKEKSKPDIVLEVERDINILKDKGIHTGTVGEYLASRVSAISTPPAYRYGSQNTFYAQQGNEVILNQIDMAEVATTDIDIENVYQIDIYYKNKFAWFQILQNNTRRQIQNIAYKEHVFIYVKLINKASLDNYKKGIRQTYYNGYSQSKKFYHADNSKLMPGEADFRRTLYWNPNVKTDKQGKAKISFYNNSSCKQMSVSAEGITEKGVFIIGEKGIKKKE